MDMAGRHRARFSSIQIRDTKIVPAGVRALNRGNADAPACNNTNVKQFLVRRGFRVCVLLLSLGVPRRSPFVAHRYPVPDLQDQVPVGAPRPPRVLALRPHPVQGVQAHDLLLVNLDSGVRDLVACAAVCVTGPWRPTCWRHSCLMESPPPLLASV